MVSVAFMLVAAMAAEQGKLGISPLSSQIQSSHNRSMGPRSPAVWVVEPSVMTCPRDGGTMWWVMELAPFAAFVFADTVASASSQVKVGRPCIERHLLATSRTFWPPTVAPELPDDGGGGEGSSSLTGADSGAGAGAAAGASFGAGAGAGT